ncbi:DNAH1, partial [Symbiodinium necroappetens]
VQESQPKVLFTELPSLWFLPVKDRKPNPKDYRCPTYKVLSRKGTLLTTGHSTNFVLYLELPTDQAGNLHLATLAKSLAESTVSFRAYTCKVHKD